MTTIALYEISAMRDVLDLWLDEADGEMTPELEALLAELDAKADEKIERVALYVREQLSRAAQVKEEVQRLQTIQKRSERAAESLKAYLHREMERLGKTKVTGLLCTVAIQNNPPSVKGELTQEALIEIHQVSYADPRCIVRYIPESYALDRKAVLDLHKSGTPLPEGLSVEQGTSLRIR